MSEQDTTVVDIEVEVLPTARGRLWTMLDVAFEHHAWVSLWARDYPSDLERDVRRWVAARPDMGLQLEDTTVVDERSKMRVLSIRRGRNRTTFCDVYYPALDVTTHEVVS